eukprot:scaffold76059_cov30-Tisochrysis_lutea.AAC.1
MGNGSTRSGELERRRATNPVGETDSPWIATATRLPSASEPRSRASIAARRTACRGKVRVGEPSRERIVGKEEETRKEKRKGGMLAPA